MPNQNCTPAIVALAGRRIDPQDAAVSRFPISEAEQVFHELLRLFQQERVERLVCSAACGADILALEAASRLSIPATIVIPFSPDIFRAMSVTDRLGDWGERYDHVVKEARDRNDLIELGYSDAEEDAYSETNSRIIQVALTSQLPRKLAFVVWEGQSRGTDDFTSEFLKAALSCGFEKKTVLTKRRM